MRIVYRRAYDIHFFGLERLHPFDSRRAGRAWKLLRRRLGPALKRLHARPRRPLSRRDLLRVHSVGYLKSLRRPRVVANALELPKLKQMPGWMIDWRVLRPMRWAAAGTLLGARLALDHGLAVNLAGGFHHAKPESGEGFCIYNDIAIAVQTLRAEGRLAAEDRIAYIDLDAHQGNGVCHCFRHDLSFFVFDMFNGEIYPQDREARERIDLPAPLTIGCAGDDYLATLRRDLPGFLDGVARSRPIRLAIYNAGTDIVSGDPIGLLDVSPEETVERDLYVVEQLRSRKIPTLMLPSGGYTKISHRLLAATLEALADRVE